MSGLNDEEMARFEQLSNAAELDDAQMAELEQLDARTKPEPITTPELEPAPIAPSVTGFTAEDVASSASLLGSFDAAQSAAAAREARHEGLRAAFGMMQGKGEKTARALKLSETLGVRFSDALGNLDGFEKAAEAASFDPAKFEKQNPMLAQLLERRPELTDLVLREKELPLLVQGLERLRSWATRPEASKDTAGDKALKEQRRNELEAAAKAGTLAPGLTPAPPEAELSPEALAVEQATFDAAAAKRLAPEKVLELNDAKARYARENGGDLVLLLRGLETQKQFEVGQKQVALMNAEMAQDAVDRGLPVPGWLVPGDVNRLRGELRDLQLEATPRAYGDDSGLARFLSVGLQGGLSSLEVAKGAVKGLTVGAGLGAIGGGVVGGVVTAGSPAGIGEGMLVGGEMAAGPGAKLGTAWASFNLELGPTYATNRELKTDAGQKLSPLEAGSLAIFQSAIKAGLESVSFGAQLQTLKSAAIVSRAEELMISSPAFRQRVIEFGTEWMKSTGTEGLTGGLQDLVDQLGSYLGASAKDAAFQKGPVVDVRQTLAATEAEAAGGFMFGATGAVPLAMQGVVGLVTAKQAHTDQQIPALLALSESPTVQAAPQSFAEVIQESAAADGAPVTALHVDASAIVRYFQEKGDDGATANATVAQILGPDAPARLLEAAAAGGKLEVPLEAALSTWGSSELGKALVDDTTTDPEGLTPRQRKEQAAELEAATQKIVEEEVARTQEAALLEERTKALEQQLVDAGQSKPQARAGAALVRAFMATQAADFEQSVAKVFPSTPIEVAKGDEQPMVAGLQQEQTDPLAPLRADAQAIMDKPEGKQRAMFFDTLTGLLNLRGFDLVQKANAGGVVVALTSTDVKPINDKVSHVETDRFFKLLGSLAASADPTAARSGTNFLFRAQSLEEAQKLVALWKQQLPEGMRLSLGAGTSASEALSNLEDRVDAGRAMGRVSEGLPAEALDAELLKDVPDAAPLPSSRLGTDLNLDALKQGGAFGDVAPIQSSVPSELTAAADAIGSTDAFVRQEYFDQLSDGLVLNARGFEAAGQKAWVMAFDGIGLKALNEKYTEFARSKLGFSRSEAKAFGKRMGNVMLKFISDTAHRLDGTGVSFARLSGDEYAAKHDDHQVLRQFAADLLAELEAEAVDVDLPDGSTNTITAGLRWGIGERTYERADEDLALRKSGGRSSQGSLPRPRLPSERSRLALPGGVVPGTQEAPGGGLREAGGGVEGGGPAGKVTRLPQGEGVPKGYADIKPDRSLQSTIKVFLNKSADVSTVVHESMHAFFEHLGDLAERPDAPQRTKDTYAGALKALGVATRSEVTKEHHEKLARSFEAYTMEGKAPSGPLRKVFARFTRWLVSIYRAITGIPGADLSPELRQVFDAMLATEDQLAAVRRAQGPQLTAEQLQLREEERRQQLEEEAEEYTEGSHAAQLRAIQDAVRVREKWWKDGLRKLERALGEEYENMPARVAQRILSGEESGEPVMLDRALVQEVIGDARVPGLRTTESGGVRPSVVAELSGYASPRAMLAALAGLRPKETWVRQQAESTMRQMHPAILDDLRKFRGLLSDGLRSATERRLLREVQGLNRDALKLAAERLVQRREVSKLQPARALAQQRQAANAKARAMAKGDINATRSAAQAELLNHFLHAELKKAEADVGRFETLAKRLGKTSARERLGKASPAYRDAVDLILAGLGLSSVDAPPAALSAVAAQLEGDAVTIGDPDWMAPVRAALGRVGDYQKLTVAELGQVHDALTMLDTAARNRLEVLVDGKKRDFEEVKAEVLEEIVSTLPDRGPYVEPKARTLGEKVHARLSWFDGYLLTPIDLVRDVTGDNADTTIHRVLVNTARRSGALEASLLEERAKPIIEAIDAMPKEVRESLEDVVPGRELFPTWNPDVEPPRRLSELLVLALNYGSESSRKVVLEGFNITHEQVVRALQAHLKPEHVALINTIWSSLEALREPAFALEERVTGLRPKAVEAVPLELASGALKGGYYPLKANRGGSSVGQVQFGENQAAVVFDPTFTRPTTSHGHTKSRTGATYPVTLDLDITRRHLLQVTHDLAWRESLTSMARIVQDEDVQRALKKTLGVEKTAEFLLWLKDIGGATGGVASPGDDILGFFKKNLATSALSGFPVAIGNFANLPAAVASTPLKAKHLAAGIAAVVASPWDMVKGTSTAREEMLSKSGVMRAENSDLVQKLSEGLNSANAGAARRRYNAVREAGMVALRTVDSIVSTAVWTGAYRQALIEGKDEAEAVRWADDIHSRVQPSKQIAEKARILRDKRSWIGAATLFYGYLNVAYRTQHRLAAPLFTKEFKEAGAAKKTRMAATVAGGLLGFYIAFQVLGDLGMGRGPEDGDRDDEEPDNKLLKWRNWFARKLLVAPLSTIPVLPLTSLVEGALLKKKTTPRVEPVTATLFQFARLGQVLMKDEPTEEEIYKASMPLIGSFAGLQTRFVDTTGKYIWEVSTGARPVGNVGRFLGGILYGEKDGQPENLPTLIGDGLDPIMQE